MECKMGRQNCHLVSCSLRCAICAAALSLSGGCQSENSGSFQSFKEKRQSGYVPPESFPNESGDSEFEPLTAEFEPDPAIAEADQPVSALTPSNVVDGSNLEELLRVSKASPAAPTGDATASDTTPRKVELLIKEREFRPEGAGTLRVNYDDLDLLKILNMEPVPPNATDYFPAWLSGLDGQRIRIRGFMIPTFESTGLERFVLARDAGLCCFGANPKVYDLISVELKAGKTCNYIHLRPFDVVGTFKIDLVAEGEKPLGLYWLEDAEIVVK
jgi:hypothetical protein